MGKTVIRVRGGAFDRPELATLSVGRASAQELELVGVPDGVMNVMVHVGRPGTDNYSAVLAHPLPDGRWGVYVSGLYFPEVGKGKYHVTGKDGHDGSVWLGWGRLFVEQSVLNVDEEDVPLVPEDTWVRNPKTGLWHKLEVTVEDGVLVPEFSNVGVSR